MHSARLLASNQKTKSLSKIGNCSDRRDFHRYRLLQRVSNERVEADDVGLVQSVTLERIGQYPVNLRVVSRESAGR